MFGDWTYVDLWIPVAFVLAIHLVTKHNKKRLNQKRHEIANSLEYDAAYPAVGVARYDAIVNHIKQHFPSDWSSIFDNTNFYLVPEPHLNGRRIYGLALFTYNRVFLDEYTVKEDTDTNAYGLILHEFAHILFQHTRGTDENERQAGQFTKEWLKTILGVDA